MVETSVIEQFAAYPFDTDQAFQEGLSRILDSTQADSTSDESQEDILGRAKAFYFSSVTGHRLSWDEIRTATESTPTQQRDAGQQSIADQRPSSEDRVLSFAEITALIESNQTHLIPNNEDISGGTSEEVPSSSKEEPRRKPWELTASLDTFHA